MAEIASALWKLYPNQYQLAKIDGLMVNKASLDCYGDLPGFDWKPYLQEANKEVVSIAQRVADDEGFIPYPLTVEDVNKLGVLISEAKKNSRVVVLLVDTWTLYVQKYRALMKHYDNVPLTKNCVLLVVWNSGDEDTQKNREALRQTLRLALLTVSDLKDERYFVEVPGSLTDFTKTLSITLSKKRQQLIEDAELIKKIETEATIAKPEIPAPGGN